MNNAKSELGAKCPGRPERKRMKPERKSITHKFTIIGGERVISEDEEGRPVIKNVDVKGYITVGLYDDGNPGEIFLSIGKQGGPYAVYDSLMTVLSVGLQYGIPLSVFVNKFKHTQFEPAGITKNESIPMAKSILDYVARWLEMSFQKEDEDGNCGFSSSDEGREGVGGGDTVIQSPQSETTKSSKMDEGG